MKHGGSVTFVIKAGPGRDKEHHSVVFDLKLLGDEELFDNPAAQLAAEIEIQDKRYLRKKGPGAKKQLTMAPAKRALNVGREAQDFYEGLRQQLPDYNRRKQVANYRQAKINRDLYKPDTEVHKTLAKDRKEEDRTRKHKARFTHNDREAYDWPDAGGPQAKPGII